MCVIQVCNFFEGIARFSMSDQELTSSPIVIVNLLNVHGYIPYFITYQNLLHLKAGTPFCW